MNPWEGISKDDLVKLSARELKIVRNYFFAVRGYGFKTKMLRDFYSQFFWYKPDSDLDLDIIELSRRERDFIDKVIEVEKRK